MGLLMRKTLSSTYSLFLGLLLTFVPQRMWAETSLLADTRIYPKGQEENLVTSRALGSNILVSLTSPYYGTELFSIAPNGGAPTLVKDIRPGNASSNPQLGQSIEFNGYIYFYTSAGLYRSNGTADGTEAVSGGPSAGSFATAGGYLFLGNTSGLYQTDGSAPTFTKVSSQKVYQLSTLNDSLYGLVNFSSSGTELASYSGGSFTLLKDINPGSAGGPTIGSLSTRGSMIYFTADDGVHGRELWVSDGSSAGTQLLSDIFPGNNDGVGYSYMFPMLNSSTILFSANDGVHGTELWETDGTSAGTQMVSDIFPGAANGILTLPSSSIGNQLVFVCNLPNKGEELCLSDGTATGTGLLKEVAPTTTGAAVQNLDASGSNFYFRVNLPGTSLTELWRSDGTASGTIPLSSAGTIAINPKNFIPTGSGSAFFIALDSSAGRELYFTDGSAAGTQFVSDINYGSEHGNPQNFVEFDEHLFFAARDPIKPTSSTIPEGVSDGTLWRLSKSGNLEQVILGGSQALHISSPIKLQNELYFISDLFTGTLISGTLSKLSSAESLPSVVDTLSTFAPYNLYPEIKAASGLGIYLVTQSSGASGKALLFFNGQTLNQLKTFTGTPSTQLNSLVSVGNNVYFAAETSASGLELWKSDGTAAGTQQVADISPGSFGSGIEQLTAIDSTRLAFAANDGQNGTELWSTDGSSAGTFMLRNESGSAGPKNLVQANGILYYSAIRQSEGRELWRSDGTIAGTFQLKAIRPGNADSISSTYSEPFIAYKNKIYFAANDGVSGEELWVSDGSPDGTVLFKDIFPGNGGSQPRNLVVSQGLLFFSADDGVHGQELWRTDGTPEHTIMLSDIHGGLPSSSPLGFFSFNEKTYFSANDGYAGRELWYTDEADTCPDDVAKFSAGVCGCGIADTDADGNGTIDCVQNDTPTAPSITPRKAKLKFNPKRRLVEITLQKISGATYYLSVTIGKKTQLIQSSNSKVRLKVKTPNKVQVKIRYRVTVGLGRLENSPYSSTSKIQIPRK